MKTLIIKLSATDIRDIDYVLHEIAQHIEDGFVKGTAFPVNWELSNE